MPAPKKTPARKPKSVAKVELSGQDAHNIIQLLNRVQVQGIQEAQFLSYIATKLNQIKADFSPEAPNGEDTPSAD